MALRKIGAELRRRWLNHPARVRTCCARRLRAALRDLEAAAPAAGELPLLGLALHVPPGQVEAALRTLASLQAQQGCGWQAWVSAAPAELAALRAGTPVADHISWLEGPLTAGQLAERQGAGYAALLAPGDVLAPAACRLLRHELLARPCDFLYTDAEMLLPDGERRLRLKPGWNPDLLLGWNYPGRLACFALRRLAALPEVPFEETNAHRLALSLLSAPLQVRHLPYALITCPAHAPQCDPAAAQAASAAASVEMADGLARLHFSPPGQPRISIILCARDHADVTARCLESIFARSQYPNYEVLLVDNDSQQAEALQLYQEWGQRTPRFRCERMALPFNFSGLNNRAAWLARGELLLFLNNDTEVISPDWLEELAGQALRPGTGASAPLLLFPDGSIQHAGILAGEGRAVHAFYRASAGQPGWLGRLRVPSNFSALSAACLMLRRELFEEVRGFDESLGIAYNDVDLCLKLRQKGYHNVLLPHIRLTHHESASRGHDDAPEQRERRAREFDLLLSRWPELAWPDPLAHPCLRQPGEEFEGYG